MKKDFTKGKVSPIHLEVSLGEWKGYLRAYIFVNNEITKVEIKFVSILNGDIIFETTWDNFYNMSIRDFQKENINITDSELKLAKEHFQREIRVLEWQHENSGGLCKVDSIINACKVREV